jgi:multimeric flavodoxin WrbA
MKVVGFVGSPRKSGNTAAVVGEVLHGAQDAGAETSMYNLNQLNIRGCQSCYKCQTQEGRCIQKDDMTKLYEEICSADAVVIGTPVYMFQMTGQTKIFIDRFFAFLYPVGDKPGNLKSKLEGKKTVTVYTQGQPEPALFGSYFNHAEGVLNFLGFKVQERIVAGGTRNEMDAKENIPVMEKAYAAGAALVKL